jgi:glycine oxidase
MKMKTAFPDISIIGAGVAGLTTALELRIRGANVSIFERNGEIGGNASWQAAGMLAPWCEGESACHRMTAPGLTAIDWWNRALPGLVKRTGTLVVAMPRDADELNRFAARTSNFCQLAMTDIADLEPDLAGRFRSALYFRDEAHLDPRKSMLALYRKLSDMGVQFHFNHDNLYPPGFDLAVDCTGMGFADKNLRAVRGEILLLRTSEVALTRPVRLLHPRFPIYVVPREDHCYLVGATMIESDSTSAISARSAMELLNAAYALHPAFGEAEIVETAAALRPAWPDNLPRVSLSDKTIVINGLYRHGFLLGPEMAKQAATRIFEEF